MEKEKNRKGGKNMSEIADIIINDQNIVILGLASLFTLLTIAKRSIVLEVLTWVSWFICGGVHLLASPTSTPLYSIAIFYWGLGLVFFVIMWSDLFSIFTNNKKTRGVGPI